MNVLIKIITFIAVFYGVVVLALYLGQRKLIYHPDPTHTLPATLGLTTFREERLETPDGEKIVTWHAEPQSGQPTILYFHGNGGTLAGRAGRLQALHELGFGIAIMSYRGYSGSTGRPTLATNMRDARQLYDLLRSRGTKPDEIFLHGESLGTGVATRLARDVEIAGLILGSPFTSLLDRAAELYPYVPVRPFITDNYPVVDLITQINAPLLVLHGERDQVIPSRMGQAVFDAALEPKTLKLFPQGNHSDLYNHGALDAVRTFVRQHSPTRSGD